MIFPNRSTKDFALKANAIEEDLKALTLCLFVKVSSDAGGHQNVYSYADEKTKSGNGIYLQLHPFIVNIGNVVVRYMYVNITTRDSTMPKLAIVPRISLIQNWGGIVPIVLCRNNEVDLEQRPERITLAITQGDREG